VLYLCPVFCPGMSHVGLFAEEGRAAVLRKALESIRDAENQAANIVKQAHKQAAELRDESSQTIRSMEESAKTQIAHRRKALLNEAEERGSSRAQELITAAKKHIEDLRVQAATRAEQAADRILEELAR
jgi:V/A-type H+/Na+-transporting ATPase subunit G/H